MTLWIYVFIVMLHPRGFSTGYLLVSLNTVSFSASQMFSLFPRL